MLEPEFENIVLWRLFMFVYGDLKTVFVYCDLKTVHVCLWWPKDCVCLLWPEDCSCLFMVTWRLFMFVYGDLKTVYVCLWWPEDCLCLFMVTWRLFMFVYGDLKTVYVCLWWPEDCLCLFMVTWRLFMFVYGDLKTVYVDLVLWRSLLGCMHWVCIFFSHGFTFSVAYGVQLFLWLYRPSTYHLKKCSEYLYLSSVRSLRLKQKNTVALTASLEWMHSIVWALIKVLVQCLEPSSEVKNTAVLTASLEWMHSIVWALIGGCVGVVTTSILSSGAGTMGLRHSVCCVQSFVPGLLPASPILSKCGT